jgi:hypothetical protein
LFNKHIITNASREGARAGIVSREDRFEDVDGNVVDDIVEAVVNNWVNNLITFGDTDEGATVDIEIFDCADEDADCEAVYDLGDPSTGSFHEFEEDPPYDWDNPCRDFECPLRVTVRYDYEFLVLSIFGFGPITLDGTSEMRME